ncbi:hypothetical protein EIP91_003722 [Steccherinum ochraceum]|uniref:Transcription factor CBF/NF-Y/archaeal histone domain-containing protein n=1 Tax=Steccherinum ochraceum TaxID=92696 RepID=A0A4R0RNJ9_9APHY|nr:hypothetical protein EIP91_003722 [Steccherinum ochraceum]
MKNKNKQTKFPVARIKRIMQKDEEVGKVAQATPIVISKALELFLGLIIDEANKVTAERGSKKVEAYHLKHAVENVDMLDFLKEIVEAVPDPSAGGTIDLNADSGEKEKKRRGKGKRAEGGPSAPRKRRRKADQEKEEEEEEEEGDQETDNYDNGRQNGDDDEWDG